MISRSYIFQLLSILLICPIIQAQEPSHTITVEVTDKREQIGSQLLTTPPSVSDGKILEGKKVTITNTEALPEILTNNYRQILSQTPGLLTSEVGNESFSSISYRGLGDPHESFNILILKDGIPVAAEPYGYPANYYMPPIDTVEKTEFYRGGASLLFGPQPGGALNFVTKKAPINSGVSLTSRNILGSKDLFSTYTEISGGDNDSGALAFFHRRSSDGFRTFNSDYEINNGGIKFSLVPSVDTKVFVDIDVYDATHGDPGGLSNIAGEELAFIGDNRFQSTLKYDTLDIERYAPSVSVEHEISKDTSLYIKTFGSFYGRYSRRQSYGTAPTFGGIPNGTGNTIQKQQFSSGGIDTRIVHDWDDNTATFGVFAYGSESPYTQSKGETPFATSGVLDKELHRRTGSLSLIAENTFRTGDLSVTPGVRIENIAQRISETYNSAEDAVIRSDNRTDSVPLFGLGSTFDISQDYQLYANISQGYKPITFTDSIPLQSGDTVSSNLDPSYTATYEVGVKGDPVSWATFDSSVFYTSYRNQFGRVGSEIQNVGRSRYQGIDASTEISLTKLFSSNIESSRDNGFSLYANASILNAEFTAGPVDGKTPQYAPDYLIRTGILYTMDKDLKLGFLGNVVDSMYADDGNSENRFMSSYRVWDLTAEIPVWQSVNLVAGINNVFDEEYISRIRSNGIEPANPRNWYGGVSFVF